MGPDDQVILVTHQPRWLMDWYWEEAATHNLRQLVRGHLRGRARVHLAGNTLTQCSCQLSARFRMTGMWEELWMQVTFTSTCGTLSNRRHLQHCRLVQRTELTLPLRGKEKARGLSMGMPMGTPMGTRPRRLRQRQRCCRSRSATAWGHRCTQMRPVHRLPSRGSAARRHSLRLKTTRPRTQTGLRLEV